MNAGKTFSRFGWAMFAFLSLSTVATVIFSVLFEALRPGAMGNGDVQSLVAFVSVDLIGLAVFWLLVRGMPKFALKRERVGIGRLFIFFSVCLAVAALGSIAGVALSELLSGGNAENYVSDLMDNPGPFTIFGVVVFGPIAEEIIFRKLVIDRTVQYGEKTAIVFSSVLFGVMHGNFYQLFYAFAIGLVFAYVYARSGKIRYTIALHMIFNLVCGVFPGLPLPETLFAAVNIAFTILGFAFIFALRSRIYFRKTIFELHRGEVFKTAYINAGMLFFYIAAAFEFVLSLI